MKTDTRDPVCRDCFEDFDADSSPDVACCPRCAEDRQWREGGADHTEQIYQTSRLSAGPAAGEV